MTEKNYNPEQKTAKVMQQKPVGHIEAKPKTEVKKTEKVEEKKQVKQIVKKEFAEVNARNLPISKKCSMYICNFIKGKTIDKAIADLEDVLKFKKAVPMKGEIPHRHGEGMMSGRFPQKASSNFILLLKGLKGNSIVNGIENPVITTAIANFGPKQYGRFGRTHKKRTHVNLIAKNKKSGGKK